VGFVRLKKLFRGYNEAAPFS